MVYGIRAQFVVAWGARSKSCDRDNRDMGPGSKDGCMQKWNSYTLRVIYLTLQVTKVTVVAASVSRKDMASGLQHRNVYGIHTQILFVQGAHSKSCDRDNRGHRT